MRSLITVGVNTSPLRVTVRLFYGPFERCIAGCIGGLLLAAMFLEIIVLFGAFGG